jgi:hypothetical protein
VHAWTKAAVLDAVGEGALDGVHHAPDGGVGIGVGIGVGVNERQVARPLARQVLRWLRNLPEAVRPCARRPAGPAYRPNASSNALAAVVAGRP